MRMRKGRRRPSVRVRFRSCCPLFGRLIVVRPFDWLFEWSFVRSTVARPIACPPTALIRCPRDRPFVRLCPVFQRGVLGASPLPSVKEGMRRVMK